MRHRQNERTLGTKMDEKGRTHREQVWKKSHRPEITPPENLRKNQQRGGGLRID